MVKARGSFLVQVDDVDVTGRGEIFASVSFELDYEVLAPRRSFDPPEPDDDESVEFVGGRLARINALEFNGSNGVEPLPVELADYAWKSIESTAAAMVRDREADYVKAAFLDAEEMRASCLAERAEEMRMNG